MKNLSLILIFLAVWQYPFAQNIENPSFDSLYIGALNRVWNWTSSDAHRVRSYQEGDTIMATEPNYTFMYAQEVVWSINSIWETPYSNAAISLQTAPGLIKENGEPFETYLTNGANLTTGNDGYINLKKSGTPFPYKPMSLKGYYQFTDEEPGTADYGKCIILLKKYNSGTGDIDTIGFAKSTMDLSITTDWEAFEIPIEYNSNETPDSIVIAFYAGTNPDELQTLSLDELEFDFTTSVNHDADISKSPLIYPNPSNGTVFVDTFDQEVSSFQLYNTKGQLLKSGAFEKALNLNEFSNQLFLLQLKTLNNQTFTYKLLKQ